MYPYYENNLNYCMVFKNFDFYYPAHVHSQIEILYILEGSLKTCINGVDYEVGKGDVMFIFPYVSHDFKNIENAHNKIVIYLFPAEYTGSYFKQIIDYIPQNPIIRADELNEDIEYLLNKLSDRDKYNIDEKITASMLELIMGRALQTLKLYLSKYKDSYSIANKIINYVTEHYKDNLTLDVLSKKLGTSKSHLSYVFTKRFGTNFREYLNSIRILKSAEMLRSTDMTITEILLACGYESPRTFNRAFKDIYGMSPTQYRYGTSSPVP